MKVIILAAGFGNRMRPLTASRQKTLLSVGGRTIIDRILDGLRIHDITEVCLVTGYRAEELRAHVTTNHPDVNFKFVHNDRYDKTNNIYSMALAFEELEFDSDLILIESDLVYDPTVLGRLLRSDRENVALVDRYRPGMDGTVVTINSESVVTQVIPPSQQGENFDFTDKYKTLNIYRFGRRFCETTFRRLLTYYARVIDDNCYYELVLGMLIYMQQAEIHAEVLDGEKWSEIDDPNDLRVAEFMFNRQSRYDLLEKSYGGYWEIDVLDFAFIRNMHFPPAAMLSQLRFHLPELLWNYGSGQSTLDMKLSWAVGCPVEHLHAVSGSSQCYPWLRSWFAELRVLLPAPSFGEYGRIFPEAETYRDRPGISWDEIGRHAHESDLIVFVNPNNPTGTTLASEEIAEFARSNPAKLVLVDESFIDFAGQPSLLRLLAQDPLDNVVIVKSLSKCLGVPGLRLGFMYTTNQHVSEDIAKATPIWNLNSMAENFLELMLKHRSAFEESLRQTAMDRRDLSRLLEGLPVVERVFPSGGNFVLAKLRMSAEDSEVLARRLVEVDRVYTKDVSKKFGDGCGYWRLAVRGPADHQRLGAALSTLSPGPPQRR